MQAIVKSRHTHVSEGVKEMAQKKLEKVQKLVGKVISIEVEFTEEHNPRIADKHCVEVLLSTKAHVFRAHASGPDPASAVDMVVDKLNAQVKKLKGKRMSRGSRIAKAMRRGAIADGSDALLRADGSDGSVGYDADGAGSASITKMKRFALKPMTAEEAVLQMQTHGHDFYLFLSAESEQAGVVYKRSDGSFGLIEPE